MQKQRILVLVGLPGSGKTTFANRLVSCGWAKINEDELGDKAACEAAFMAALTRGKEIVVDRCNHTWAQRKIWTNLAIQQLERVHLIALFLKVHLTECVERTQARSHHPMLDCQNAEETVLRFASEFEALNFQEGFHEIFQCGDEASLSTLFGHLSIPRQVNLMDNGRLEGQHGSGMRQGLSPSRRFRLDKPRAYGGKRHGLDGRARYDRHRHEHSWPDHEPKHNPVHPLPASINGVWDVPRSMAPSTSRRLHNRNMPDLRHDESVGNDLWSNQFGNRHGWMYNPSRQSPQGFFHPEGPGCHGFGMGCEPEISPFYPCSTGESAFHHKNARGPGWNLPEQPQGMHRLGHGHQAMPDRRFSPRVSGYQNYPLMTHQFGGSKRKRSEDSSRDFMLPPPKKMEKVEKFDPRDGKITILFDLNGTLTEHTTARYARRSTVLRPGLKHLLRLKEKFHLGIFTSSTSKTVRQARLLIEKEVDDKSLFDIVLHRDHTSPFLMGRPGGRPWDTVKPLRKWIRQIHRVVLFDDDIWKAAEGEQENMVTVPSWTSSASDDSVVEHMVDLTLSVLGDLSEDADVRCHTKKLTELLSKVPNEEEKNSIVPANEVVAVKEEPDNLVEVS